MRAPDYERGNVRLWCDDCLKLLPEIEAGSVDAVVTDPPFGIGWSRGTWNDSEKDYPKLIKEVVIQSQRIVVNGWCFFFQGMPTCDKWRDWFPEGWRIFAACKNFAQIRPTGIWHSWDPVIFWSNGKVPRLHDEATNRDWFVGNVAGLFGENSEHPCPKPLDTMRNLVVIGAPLNSLVIDPFLGSGSTILACLQTKRSAMGIEIEPKYFEIACRRVDEEFDKMALIDPTPPAKTRQLEFAKTPGTVAE